MLVVFELRLISPFQILAFSHLKKMTETGKKYNLDVPTNFDLFEKGYKYPE